MPDPPPLMIFFQFVSKKIDLGQKLPLRGQISPTKFIILCQNFYVYASKSIKTHCFLTHDDFTIAKEILPKNNTENTYL